LIYCDTSFLAALYLPEDVFEPVARPIAADWDRGFHLIIVKGSWRVVRGLVFYRKSFQKHYNNQVKHGAAVPYFEIVLAPEAQRKFHF
jgi:hypothetical protein